MKKIEQKERNSNYELLRVVAMFMIVFLHVIVHGKVVENLPNNSMTFDVVNILLFFAFMFTSTFILITGYFQCEKDFKLKSIFKLNNAMWFYSAILGIIMFILKLDPKYMNKFNVLLSVLPIQFGGYWFTKMYICLYAITPFLNILINNMNQKQHKYAILVFFFMFAVLPTLTNNLFYDGGRGLTLINFIMLYIIGAYLKKYPLEKSKLFVDCSKYKFATTFLFILFIAVLLDFLAYKFGISFKPGRGVSGYLNKLFASHSCEYTNPLNIIGSVSLFVLFGLLKFNSKFINKLAGLMIGIYLIHEYTYLNDVLYSYFGFANVDNIGYAAETNMLVLVRIFATAVIVFICCTIIEFIRQAIFKFIYNRKISEKCRNKFYEIIDNF